MRGQCLRGKKRKRIAGTGNASTTRIICSCRVRGLTPQEFSLKGVTSPYSRWGLAPRPLLGWLSLGYPRLLPLRLVLFIVFDAWFCVLYRSALRYRRREALRSFTSPCLCVLLRLFCHDCLLQFTAPPSGKGKNKARTRKEKKQRQEKKKKQR